MANIITRAGKGAPLSWNEADANFINLNTELSVHIDDAIDAHASSAIGYIPAGTGAVARDVQSKLRELVSVKDFGAVGDGVTDDTAEIQAAFNHIAETGKKLVVPAGRYLITSTITATNSGGNSIVVEGEFSDSSEFVLNTGGDGITLNVTGSWWSDFSGNPGAGVKFSNIRLSTNNVNVGTGLSIIGDSVEGRPRVPIIFDGVSFSSNSGLSQFWLTGLSLLNTGAVYVSNSKFTADSAQLGTSIKIDGTLQANSPVIFCFNNCEITYGATSIAIGNYVEGVYINNSTLIGAKRGVSFSTTSGESGLHISNCHFNNSERNVYIKNVFDINITGCLFYRSGTAVTHAGIELDTTGRFAITGNVFLGRNSATFYETGIQVTSTVYDEKYGGVISGNTFHAFASWGIWLTANANYVHIGENLFRLCAVRVLNQSTNVSNSIAPKVYALSSSRTLVGGAATENISITLPVGMFRIKPAAAICQADSGSVLSVEATYSNSASSETTAVFVVRNPAGGNIVGNTYRFSFVLFENAYTGSF